MRATADALGVLGQVLAAEHAAVFGYGAAAAALDGAQRNAALDGLDAHRRRRDELRRRLIEAAREPVEAEAAYKLPRPLGTPRDVARLLAEVEREIAVAYGALVEASTDADRRFAARMIQEAAVREAGWRGDPPRFPGLAEPPLLVQPSPSPSP